MGIDLREVASVVPKPGSGDAPVLAYAPPARTLASKWVRRIGWTFALLIGLVVLVPFVQLGLYVVRTVHPPTILMNPGEASMSGDMLATLLLAFASFTLLYIALLRARYRFAVERDGAHPPETYID